MWMGFELFQDMVELGYSNEELYLMDMRGDLESGRGLYDRTMDSMLIMITFETGK